MASAPKSLPRTMEFVAKPAGAPARSYRATMNPQSGQSWSGQQTAVIELSGGTPGTFLDASQSYLEFTIRNGTNQALTLDGSGMSVLETVDVFFGGNQVSSVKSYNVIASGLLDHQVSTIDRKTTWTSAGCADYSVTAVSDGNVTVSEMLTGYYNRDGITLASSTGVVTVAFPLINCLGVYADKYIPLGALRDNVKLQLTFANASQWGKWAAEPTDYSLAVVKDLMYQAHIVEVAADVDAGLNQALNGIYAVPTLDITSIHRITGANDGSITMHIPIRVSSANAVFVIIRETATVSSATLASVGGRTKGTMVDYAFRLGPMRLPAIPVKTTDVAEARIELAKAFHSVGMAIAPSGVSKAQYNGEAFMVGIQLDAFAHAQELMSDGQDTTSAQLFFEATLASTHNALRVDAFVLHDKMLVVENGLLNYSI